MKKETPSSLQNSFVALRDVWLHILSFILFPKDVRSCKLVCKLWKSWIEQVFDHSFQGYLPLVSNCEKGNKQEVQRLLHTLSNKTTGYLNFCRNPLCTPFPEIVELLLASNRVDPAQTYKVSYRYRK